MISASQFRVAIKQNAARIKDYDQGHDGRDGSSDCIGLIIGALRLAGQIYSGTHGSNYFARYVTKQLRPIGSASDLRPLDIVYKSYTYGDPKWALPARYEKSGDTNDYCHVGVVMSVNPLSIWHCSSGGMHYDTKIGRWSYYGSCTYVGEESTMDTPYYAEVATTSGKLNVRSGPGTEYNSIDKLAKDTQVKVITHGDWDFVEYGDGTTKSGYVSSLYMRPIAEVNPEPDPDEGARDEWIENARMVSIGGAEIELRGLWRVADLT